jgi:hypothetical protein
MRWEVRPALRTADFFEALYAAIAAEEWESLPAILREYEAEVVMTG